MNRSISLILACMMAAAVLLAACDGGISSGTSSPTEPHASQTPSSTATPQSTTTPVGMSGTISIWHSWEPPYVSALLRSIYAFSQLYPNVYFDVQYVPALDLRNAFEQAALEGNSPTLLIGDAAWGPDFHSKGFVADLSGLLPGSLLNTLNPAAVGSGRYQGALLSVPVDINGVVLYRNQSIIPIAPSTFDELVSLAKDASHGQKLGALLDRSFLFSGATLIGLGGHLMTPDGKPAFADAKGLEWVSLLQTFSEAGPTEFFSDNDLNLFQEGRVGFIIDGTWNRNALKDALGVNLAIDPWPIHAGGSLSGFVRAESIYLTPQAMKEEQGVSLKFLQFFLSPESQAAVAEVGLIPAINGSPVSLAANQIRVQDPLISQAMLALVDGVTYPVDPEMSIYSSQMDIALKSIFEGGVSPEEALLHAQEEIGAALENTPVP